MTIRFFLEKQKANSFGEVPVAARVRASIAGSYHEFRLATGHKLLPKFWNQPRQEVKRQHPYSAQYNKFFFEFREKIRDIWRNVKNEIERPEFPDFKNAILDRMSEKREEAFFDVYDRYLKYLKTNFSFNNYKANKTVRNDILTVQDRLGANFTFSSIDFTVYDAYIAYSYESGLSNNTTAKRIARFKSFLNWATERGFNKNDIFKKFSFKERQGRILFLTEEELNILYDCDFYAKGLKAIEAETLDEVRDTFCFGCFTGQRFSDIINLDRSSVKNGVWFFTSQKTKTDLSIHLNKKALRLLEKYNHLPTAFPRRSNQKLNVRLKKACRIAGIDDEIILTKYVGSKRIDEKVPKWQAITSHVGRKTFITLSLIKGMNPAAIMAQVGIKEYSTLKHYMAVANSFVNDEIKRVWDAESPELKLVKSG